MKNIFIIIVAFFIFNSTRAQEPELVETIWYLNELIIDEVSLVPPSNEDLPFVDLVIVLNSDASYSFISNACSCFLGEVVFSPGFMTLPTGLTFLLGCSCEFQENNDFDIIYFDDFFRHEEEAVTDPIAYQILTDADGNLQLTLTNSNGDIAVYGDVLLNVQNQELTLFTISPNPIDDILQLNFSGNTFDASITLYDALGSEVYSYNAVTASTTSLNLAHLQSGLYFVQVVQGNQKSVQKFVKR